MAAKHIFSSLSLLFLITSSYSSPVHARYSKFFSKTASSPEYAPAPAPGPATAPAQVQLESGYGLYGSESEYSNTFTPQKEHTNNYENEVVLTGIYNNNIDEETLSEDESSEKPNDDIYNENGYYDNYKRTITNSNNEGQGMSDTRYMESGKYYYDIKSDHDLTYQNNNNGYYSSTTTSDDETIDPQVYGSSNEFNAMEEYYRNTKEQEYVP